MSRRQRAVKREIPADPRYGSTTVTKFVNSLMMDGKKCTAERIFYEPCASSRRRRASRP